MAIPSSKQVVSFMEGLYPLRYEQQLGQWDAKLNAVRRPDPRKVKYGDCTSTIQTAFLVPSNDEVNPGYYTEDMLKRGSAVTSWANPDYSKIRAGDVVIMQWWSGYYHAEMAVSSTQLIGHPGPGAGPTKKNLRAYLAGARFWWVRRHPLTDHQPKPIPRPEEKEEINMAPPQKTDDTRAKSKDGMTLKPGVGRHLSRLPKPKNGSATNVTREVAGTHVTTLQVNASGTPGDVIRVRAIRSHRVGKAPYPRLYGLWKRVELDRFGRAEKAITEQLYRRSLKDYYFWEVKAHSGNKGDVKVTRLYSKSTPIN